ncbi:MAG: glutaredoxin 3 [Cyanobacteria bacterium P01_A01_bin.114]
MLGRPRVPAVAEVEIYTWQLCPYCIRAKLLLWWKGVPFREYKIDGDEAARSHMAQRANARKSVPQIFINDQHIGGCDDLYALDRQGKLDPLLAQSAR